MGWRTGRARQSQGEEEGVIEDELGVGLPLVCRGREYELTCWVSPEDLEWAMAQGNWFVTHGKNPGKRISGYAVRSVGRTLLWLHKEVLHRAGVVPPSPRHIIGDHRNGTRLDNRRGNLRWATHQQNAVNIGGFLVKQMELELWQS